MFARKLNERISTADFTADCVLDNDFGLWLADGFGTPDIAPIADDGGDYVPAPANWKDLTASVMVFPVRGGIGGYALTVGYDAFLSEVYPTLEAASAAGKKLAAQLNIQFLLSDEVLLSSSL